MYIFNMFSFFKVNKPKQQTKQRIEMHKKYMKLEYNKKKLERIYLKSK